jgi:hypothetical protein
MTRRRQGLVFLFAAILYVATSYAGIRSPDEEVVFETCDALLHRHTFAVDGQSTWEGFGLAPGRDGRSYSIFGPLQPIACVPFLAAADLVDHTRWFAHVPPPRSHYIDGGSRAALMNAPIAPEAAEMHARRTLVGWSFNALVAAATVLAFLRLCLRLSKHQISALVVTGAYGVGSLIWPYSGTFFSEPLAILLLILSFDALMADRRVWAGAALGLATCAHVTALLFLPFWLVIACGAGGARVRAIAGASFLAGALAAMAPLGVFNAARFGSIWETGRNVLPDGFGYGVLQAPWRGLWGLSLSPGKGLLLFCPVVLLGFGGWRSLAGRSAAMRLTAVASAAALVGRWLFLAARSDWHGGFSLGPRYLLMAVPFLLWPAVAWLDDLVDARRWRAFTGVLIFLGACALQQLYFVLGEIFSYLHWVKLRGAAAGDNVFDDDQIYLAARHSPLVGLLDRFRGPFLLKAWSAANGTLWLACAVVLSIACWFAGRRALAEAKSQAPDVTKKRRR